VDAKKAMMLAGVALVLVWVMVDPPAAAARVQDLLDWLGNGLAAVLDFFGLHGGGA
jgi:hypothetical protein